MFPKGTRSEAKTGELESFQRRACRSRGNDSHALGTGGSHVEDFTGGAERRDGVCHVLGGSLLLKMLLWLGCLHREAPGWSGGPESRTHHIPTEGLCCPGAGL